MKQTVIFFEKSVYGKILIYPKCDKANIFAGLTGTKTMTLGQLSLIRGLGYDVELITLPS